MQAAIKRTRDASKKRKAALGAYLDRSSNPNKRAKSADAAPRAPKKKTWEEREYALRADMRAKLDLELGSTGKGVVVTEARAAIVLAAYWMHEGSADAAPKLLLLPASTRVHLAAMASGLSRKTVVNIIRHFEAYGRIYHEDASLRGAGSPVSTRSARASRAASTSRGWTSCARAARSGWPSTSPRC
jgi:hypothetical protein